MLINAKNERIEAVFPSDTQGGKRCLSVIDRNGEDFSRDGGLFRPEAARYAAALAMSAADEAMLKENLAQLGYQNPVFLAYDGAEENKTGVAIALKETLDGVTAAIILRPTVGREWYTNFEIGYGTEHCGFLKAAEYAEQRIADYLFVRQPKGPLRLFVTGYSRGGAAANLLAKRLCDRYGLDAVRCYTFAAPNTCVTVRSAHYTTIFNLVRDEDFFTRVPLSGWGYTKYGSILSMSDCSDIRKRFRRLSGTDYIGIPSSQKVDDFLCAVMRLAPNVHAYYERRYSVADRTMTLSDYMLSTARILADEADASTGELMMDTLASDFGELSVFLMTGMDIAAFLSGAPGIPRCAVSDSHSPAAYMAALDAYLK